MTSTELYLRLLQHVWPYWKLFALSIVAMIVSAATEPAFAYLMKPLLDGTFVSRDKSLAQLIPALIVVLFVVRGAATYLNSVTMSWISNKLVMDLRKLMFDKLLSLPAPYYDAHSSGNLKSKITYDVAQVTAAGTNIITVAIKDGLTIIGLLGLLLYIDWLLTLICVAIIPFVGINIRMVSKRLRNLSRGAQKTMGEVTQVLGEAIEAQRVIKIFGGKGYEATRFLNSINELRRFNVKQTAASTANSTFVQLLIAIALAIIIYLASLRAANQGFTAGDFMSFMTAMLMLFAPIKQLTSVNESLQRGLAAAESVFALIDEKPEQDQGTIEIGRAKGQLEFRAVSFHYHQPERPALEDVTLFIQAGETIALVGPSGSGKTSLANLIPRFYGPTGGQILLDGVDLASIKLANLRANIAFVSQEVILFNDTVAANIAYGRLADVSRESIIAAATAAHAMEFIQEMPQGLDTVIGEKGLRLSGGQRQRLAIARAILKDAPVLILDEATSALDTESERHVQAALETLMQGRTTLVIAHRLSTIEQADRIIVLQKGRILESGTHNELLASKGLYAQLRRIQLTTEAPIL